MEGMLSRSSSLHPDTDHQCEIRYANGYVVPKDDVQANSWYRKAAEQGHALAQRNLGVRYANGVGVASSLMTGYAWMNLAAGAGDQEAPGIRQEIAERLSNPDVQKAQQLSRDWKPGQSIPEVRPAAQLSPVPPLVPWPERVRPERCIHSLPMCLAEPVAIPNVSTEVATARTMMAGECISKPSVPWMLSANGSGTPGAADRRKTRSDCSSACMRCIDPVPVPRC